VNGATRSAIEATLGASIRSEHGVAGGDINDAFRLELSDGRVVFAKTNDRADPRMFPAEARGLEWLREASVVRVPEVVAVSSGEIGVPSFLVLEYVESARRDRDFDERLGRELAALHLRGAPAFGLDHDNFIGRLPQSNARAETWVEFYRDRRLGRELERAAKAGLASAGMRRGLERLFAKLHELTGPPEPPARLHGDLWGGNLHVDDGGQPCLIDPAAYGGHREVDLAMMRLFGGFSERTFAAYDEAFPLAEGHEERVALYQLYPLMVHVNLFGSSYVSSVERTLARYV
jgi:fructosamine-3-kinase